MSAIFGIIDFEDRPIKEEWIESMQHDLAHRGPDRQDIYREESMFLGHMLLQVTPESIYDKAPYEEDGFVITAYARLDEREAIMDRIGTPTRDREYITDPLLLLRSYLKFGKDFVKDIYGDFAFAIWDREKKELFCARDQMGVKPFLYYFEENRFVFSTELKSIVKLPFVKTELDHNYNRDWALFFDVEVNRTPWKKIIRLKAANLLLVQNSETVLNQYWNLDYTPNYNYKNEDEAAKKLRELLEIAISDRMRVIGGIGIPLSGGLDSSAITTLAARKQKLIGKKVVTASSVLEPGSINNEIQDELSYINEVLKQEGNIEPTYVYNSKLSFLNNLNEKFDRHFDQVNYFHYVDEAIYQKFQSKSIKRVLSGFLGDNIASSTVKPLPHLLLNGRFGAFFKLSSKIMQSQNLSLLSLLKFQIFEPITPFFIRELWERFKGRVPFWDIGGLPLVLSAPEKRKLQRKNKNYIKNYYKFKRNILLSMWPKNWDPFGEEWDCSSSYHQIEMTYPLADRRVVEFILELPIEHFSASGYQRGLIRKALFDVFPEKIRDRQNKGAYSPAYHQIFQKDIDKIESQLERIEVKDKFGSMVEIPVLTKYLDFIANSKKIHTFEGDYFSIHRISIWLCYTHWSLNNKYYAEDE